MLLRVTKLQGAFFNSMYAIVREHTCDFRGKTAADIAMNEHHSRIVELFQVHSPFSPNVDLYLNNSLRPLICLRDTDVP